MLDAVLDSKGPLINKRVVARVKRFLCDMGQTPERADKNLKLFGAMLNDVVKLAFPKPKPIKLPKAWKERLPKLPDVHPNNVLWYAFSMTDRPKEIRKYVLQVLKSVSVGTILHIEYRGRSFRFERRADVADAKHDVDVWYAIVEGKPQRVGSRAD